MSRPLTIVHVAAYYMPGLGYQENHLPHAQAALGHRVHVVTADRYAPHANYAEVYQPRLGPRVVGAGRQREGAVEIHRLPVSYENQRRQNPVLSGLAGYLAALKPNVVHVHGVNTLLGLQAMASGGLHRRSTLVVDHHLCHFNIMPMTALKRAYYRLFRDLLLPPLKGRVAAWLPISHDAAGVLSEYLGIDGPRVAVLGLGIDAGRFRRDAELGRVWRQAHGIAGDVRLVVHAGKLEPRKNVHLLVQAGNPGTELVVVGSGPAGYMAELHALAGERVRFLPMLPNDQLPGLYNAADLGVWPGDESVTILEARGCGLPLLLAGDAIWPEAGAAPGKTLVPRGDMAALAAALAAFRPSPEVDRQAFAAAAAATLSWTSLAERSIALYRRAMEAGR